MIGKYATLFCCFPDLLLHFYHSNRILMKNGDCIFYSFTFVIYSLMFSQFLKSKRHVCQL